MTKSATDRRRAERVPTNNQVTLRHSRRQTAATAHDVSNGGIFLFTEEKLQPGAEMELVLMLPEAAGPLGGRWVSCYATVIRVENGGVAGDFGVAAKINYCEAVSVI
jgi:Tfp pilus assembly protein PilZ